jgi:hypothetical protein
MSGAVERDTRSTFARLDRRIAFFHLNATPRSAVVT